MDSSSGYCTFDLGLANEYNTQVWFSSCGMNVDLPNHVQNELVNSLHYLFTLNTLIILLVIVLEVICIICIVL